MNYYPIIHQIGSVKIASYAWQPDPSKPQNTNINKPMPEIKHYVNHIGLILDASSSMGNLTNKVVEVFDSLVKHLALRSQELNQETRLSVYSFSNYNRIKNLVFDIDVLRFPSIKDYYKADGMTALIDATMLSIEDLEKTPELYGDHAFLIYVLTDGGENDSAKYNRKDLIKKLGGLKENWTLATLVPDKNSAQAAQAYGFSTNNIQVWETTTVGLEKAQDVIRRSADTYMTNRAKGVRSTSNLFQLNTNVKVSDVKATLEQLKPSEYALLNVAKKEVIKPFVESWKIAYSPGCAYFQLTKPEKIQPYKQIAIKEKKTGKIYSGDNARQLLNLPNHEVKVSATTYKDFDVFVQSTSLNRNLMPSTQLLVML